MCQQQPREAPGITWQVHQEENWLGAAGRGLVPGVAGGSSRKDKFRHSLYLARGPGQTASQMQTVGSWCSGLTKLREEISQGLSFPFGSPHGGSSLALPYSLLGHTRLPFINHSPAVRARRNIPPAVWWTAPGPKRTDPPYRQASTVHVHGWKT